MLGRLAAAGDVLAGLPREAIDILELLRERSPMSTKEIRAEADLRGREHERVFMFAMKSLWSRLLVVGTGEVEDGAFPSLAVGATELLFEDVWTARRAVPSGANEALDAVLERTPAYARELRSGARRGGERRAEAPARRPASTAALVGARAFRLSGVPFNEPSAAEVFSVESSSGRRGRSRGIDERRQRSRTERRTAAGVAPGFALFSPGQAANSESDESSGERGEGRTTRLS